ncbi:tetratricopeptide repeat protein [Methylobacterium nodulans]|uniref:Tetratricopeptide TPR_2 repeat protein n=1 Tax=Methylobacterium nodulans (strain LMG 21967 / CNCM I-2342 / ORS 2060) TaxID=460265 RepID=B8IRF1_METNO|nr:tetratricopeptide repeat protein [Methylobacterium nodulans]ACL58691.1 Tetratricopeptide TPR_2 repeat protein [Methylobacterium nodulans ORS 2060]
MHIEPVPATIEGAGVRRLWGLSAAAVVLLLGAGCQSLDLIGVGPPAPATGFEDMFVNTNEPAIVGRKQLERGNYGLAERYFRQAVEANPSDLDSWIGLAASYDNLKRFDLADRAYEQALRLGGRLARLLNNRGYSFMVRGDFARARTAFNEALALEPNNEVILNNMKLLAAAEAKFRSGRA